MSICLNGTGKPVRINRTNTVTANTNYAPEEFQKRRLMRMEQVRQQSKEIAENVRNKVRKQQNSHLLDRIRREENEFKKRQAQKLLHLQQQYDECVRDIGLGHLEAIEEEETDYGEESRKERYDQAAKERGYRAAEKLQHENNQISMDKEAALQKRNYNHEIENIRSKLMINLNKKKNSKIPIKKTKEKVYTDLNISSRLSKGSHNESDVPKFFDISSHSCGSSPKQLLEHSIRKDSSISQTSDELDRQKFAIQSKKENVCESGSLPTTQRIDHKGKLYSVDTRISDRIKSRTILREPYTTDIYAEQSPVNPRKIRESVLSHKPRSGRSSPTQLIPPASPKEKTDLCVESSAYPRKIRESVLIHSDQQRLRRGLHTQLTPPASPKHKTEMCLQEVSSLAKSNSKSNVQYSKNSLDEIPMRPTITIHTNTESLNQLNSCGQTNDNINKVKYYDHKDRFTNNFIPDTTNVQRIPEGSMEVCPSSRSDADFVARIYKRDQDAQIRGQKALQKQKVHQDYKEMMQQLPALEKQEKLVSITSKRPVYHMSEDRLKQREKIKQNRIENAYEKLFPEARIITIPPKNPGKPSSNNTNVLPFQTINVNDNEPKLNVGSWDVDTEPKCPLKLSANPKLLIGLSESIVGVASDQQEEDVKRTEKLQDMLQILQHQRDELVKELSILPESINSQKLFGELGPIDKLIVLGHKFDKGSSTSSKTRESRSRSRRRSSKDLYKDNVTLETCIEVEEN